MLSQNGHPHLHRLFVPKQAAGANLVYFDFFNAVGSNQTVFVSSITPSISGAVAVVGTLGVDLFLTGTTAIGTGGTAATRNGTDVTACTMTRVNPKIAEPSSFVTARLTPTGGATAGAVFTMVSVFTEETAASTYTANLFDMVSRGADTEDIVLPPGYGIRVVQGAVASVGNIAFNIVFSVKENN